MFSGRCNHSKLIRAVAPIADIDLLFEGPENSNQLIDFRNMRMCLYDISVRGVLLVSSVTLVY